MNDKIMRKIEERWAYEHSPKYLAKVAIDKMKLQRERDGPSLSEIANDFLPLYEN